MTDDNYMNAIQEAQSLLDELINDPDHGKLTFEGLRGLSDLTITGPCELNDLTCGTVLSIGGGEWMALKAHPGEAPLWQHYGGMRRLTNKELYLHALADAERLAHCHAGL